MKRTEKVETVERLGGAFRASPHAILAGFSGLSVNQATVLRRRVREAGGTYQVVKNRLAKRAAVGTPVDKVAESLVGPRAVALHESDPVALAKALVGFAKENPQVELVAGVVDAEQVLGPEELKALAELPGLDELRARLLAVVQEPARRIARLLGTPGTGLARALSARRDQMEESTGGAG